MPVDGSFLARGWIRTGLMIAAAHLDKERYRLLTESILQEGTEND